MTERTISRRGLFKMAALGGACALTAGVPMIFLSRESSGVEHGVAHVDGAVLFARPKDKNKHSLYLHDFSTKHTQELGLHDGSWGVISPDGQSIALRSGGYIKPTLEIVKLADGGVEETITTVSENETPSRLPAWSPDNKKFIVQTRNEQGQPGNNSLFIREGSRPFDYLASGYDPKFRPSDGNIIAIGRTDANLMPMVLLRDLATGSEELVGEGGAHAWSPDGQYLAWNSANTAANPRPRLHIKNVNSGVIETIEGGRGPTWSPVDNNLAFVYEDTHGSGRNGQQTVTVQSNRLAVANARERVGPIIINEETDLLGSNFFWLGGEWLAINDRSQTTNNIESRLIHLSMKQEAELSHPEDMVIGWIPTSLDK